MTLIIVAAICVCWSLLLVSLCTLGDVPSEVYDPRYSSERKDSNDQI